MADDDSVLVDRIYEAGLVPALWPEILAEMTARFEGVGAVLIAAGRGGQQMAYSPGFDAVMAGFVEEGWSTRNQRLERATARRLAGFMTERDLFTDEELLADPMLSGFLLPRGIGGELGTIIAVPTGDTIALTVQRPFHNGPASTSLVAQANALRPHLARAALISARAGLDRARAAAEALRALGLPAVVLTTGGRPLAMNDLFEKLMPSVAIERRGRIGLVEPRADALLSTALGRVGDRSIQSGTRSIPVRTQGGLTPAIAHLIPIRRSAHDIFVGAASILLLAPVSVHRMADALVLEGLFDLTPAEIRLCRVVNDGRLTLPEAAKNLDISHHTTRTQLRSIFEKTGTTRQAELVKLLNDLNL